MGTQDLSGLHFIGTERNGHEPAPEIVSMLFKDLCESREKMIGSYHQAHITARGETFDLGSKIPAAGLHNFIPAALKTQFYGLQHCITLTGKGRVVTGGILCEQDFHLFLMYAL